MPCFKPLQAWRQPGRTDSGKSIITFGREHIKNYDAAKPLDLPCGRCIGCRLERSRRWAIRLMHEAQMHDKSCFLTLTYADHNVPSGGSLKVEDFQLFMKRLRRGSSSPLRFFHCGEYGCDDPQKCREPGCKHTARPHYHACIFGTDFSEDRVFYKKTKRGDDLFNSPSLTETWGLGHAVIGDLTFESAAYVARYCLKKISGPEKEDHYRGRTPEYVTMSRRPGIGAIWYERFHGDVFPSDSIIMRGREMQPPPFYDKALEKADPALYRQIKKEREQAALKFAHSEDSRSARLLVRERVKLKTITDTLRRGG